MIAFIWLLHVFKVEVVGSIIAEDARRLDLTGQIEKLERLRFVKVVVNHPNQVDPDPLMLHWLGLGQVKPNLTSNVF